MSYDLAFLPKAADQSWDDLLDAEPDESDGPPDAAAWERIEAAARQILGEVTVHRSERFCELDHEATGIQVSLYAGEAAITVPYWYVGAEAAAVVERIYALGRAVEEATGYSGYDPQLELPLAEAAADQAVAAFDAVAGSFASRGVWSPSNDAG